MNVPGEETIGVGVLQVPITRGNEVNAIYAKFAKRMVPFLIALFVVSWLDRVNVGFAKLKMLDDLGFSEAVFGFGAGIFYLGYLIFEIPSNLLLEKIGGRKTLARIAFLWGLASIATMFVTTSTEFYVVRFFLGAFEAGLYPGLVVYLSYWFPARRRAEMLGLVITAIPIAGILGGPVSGLIMENMVGYGGLANWQWLFLLEGIPSLVMGVVTLVFLVDKPSQAHYLTEREKEIVIADLEEDNCKAGLRQHGFGQAMRNPMVWILALIYFCVVSANPTLGFWGPTIIRSLGVTNNTTIGLLSAVPSIIGVIGTIIVGWHSDRTLERRYHCLIACLVSAMGLTLIGVAENPTFGFLGLVLGVTGVLCALSPFWQLPHVFLTGSAAAGGVALINSFGNLSGWFGPYVVGWLKETTGSASAGLYVVAVIEILAAILIIALVPNRRSQEVIQTS